MSRRTELLAAALWGSAGLVILVASWRMDRLTDRGINPWSAPGLTPGVVGALMVLLALVLAVKARRRAANIYPQPSPLPETVENPAGRITQSAAPATEELPLPGRERAGVRVGSEPAPTPQHPPNNATNTPDSWPSTVTALLLCSAFATLSLGRGWHFAVDAALFIFIFTSVFSWRLWRTAGRTASSLARTAAVAVLASGAISWLFESVFLVRLP